MNNTIEKIYKKKYLKYKSKYLTLQRGGVRQVISHILHTFKLDNYFYPILMALDSSGNIVVADENNNCLEVFSIYAKNTFEQLE